MKEKNNKNTESVSLKEVLMSKIDVKDGKLTFEQRIGLGKIFEKEGEEIDKFKGVFECLHKYIPKPTEYVFLIDYYYEVIGGLTHWINAENTMLKYEPSSEEIEAGISDMSKKVGEFGTIKALAKAYSRDPDEVLQWEYGKVFGILYTDLEEHKFQKKYNKVIERKQWARK